MPSAPTLTIYTDGASRGNPGAAAFAYVIQQPGKPAIEEAACAGQLTNNQAEYTALVRALEHALRLGTEHHILLHSDSELMVKQMRGEYRVKNEELRDLFERAKKLESQFAAGVTYRHVRRELNARADQLCNEALDGRCAVSSSGAPSTVLPESPAEPSGLHVEAVELLGELARAWSRGLDISPEAAWERLAALLTRHGVDLPG
jgi:ribonuclease HI